MCAGRATTCVISASATPQRAGASGVSKRPSATEVTTLTPPSRATKYSSVQRSSAGQPSISPDSTAGSERFTCAKSSSAVGRCSRAHAVAFRGTAPAGTRFWSYSEPYGSRDASTSAWYSAQRHPCRRTSL